MQVLRNVDPLRARMELLALDPEPGAYDAEIRALGSAVLHCGSTSAPLALARGLLTLLRERGPYDVVHSHVHHFSGVVLALARRAGVPVRIAHSHLDTQRLDREAGIRRRLYLAAMTAAVRRYATHGLAASTLAAEALFGAGWREDARWEIARYGLDFGAFRAPADVASVRAELGLGQDAIVLGHVGRFDPQKNHAFLVRIAAEALRRERRARVVLVGDGPLRPAVELETVRLGIRERVHFAGVRPDVPRVLRAFDAFVLPSHCEGLPLVGLEAQAAGLPIVLSDAITRELVVIPELITWRSLSDPPESWAEAALAAARGRAGPGRVEAVEALERSEFSLARTMSGLLDVYRRSA